MNFQNIPRSDKVIKQAFIPKLDALLFFDYKQIEPRLLAYYMATQGDDHLAGILRSGVDTYTAIVRQIYGKEDLTDEERQTGKVLFLSLMYGGGVPTVMRQFEVDFKTAKAMAKQFHDAWPGVRSLQDAINARVQERGYITTLFGRHLHPESEHKSLNALIQGCAADLMRHALVEVDQMLKDSLCSSHLVSVIHDELIIDAIAEEVRLLVERVPPAMDYPLVSEVVPILVDVEYSTTTWADKINYEEANERNELPGVPGPRSSRSQPQAGFVL